MSLNDCTEGQIAYIKGYASNISFYYKDTLSSQGITIGTQIKIIKKSLLFGPLIANIRGCNLMIRRNDAKMIIVSIDPII
jgi:Fe2+ transport system protein FeoA